MKWEHYFWFQMWSFTLHACHVGIPWCKRKILLYFTHPSPFHLLLQDKNKCFFPSRMIQTLKKLTQACSACEERRVEVLVVYGDGLHQSGAHGHHGLTVFSPERKYKLRHKFQSRPETFISSAGERHHYRLIFLAGSKRVTWSTKVGARITLRLFLF